MRRSADLKVHVTAEAKARFIELAKADDRTLSTYLARILESYLGDGETPEPTQEAGILGYTYFIKSGGYYKVGRARSVESRIASLSLPQKPEIVASVQCADYGRLEMALHVILENKRVNGEWFQLSDQDALAVKHLLESRQVTAGSNVVALPIKR